MRKVLGCGPAQADVVIVGEAPGEQEELEGKPFVGPSGHLLTTLLREAGINRNACYITNVCKYRPPGNDISKWVTDKKKVGIANEWDSLNGRYYSVEVEQGLAELYLELYDRKPRVIIAHGNVALWALTGEWGITDWRGSELLFGDVPLVPTLHPAAVLRQWQQRAYVAHDLQVRVGKALRGKWGEPERLLNIAPTGTEVLEFLEFVCLKGSAAVDVETSRGQIVCAGLATSPTTAMCIPFIHENYGAYWTEQQKRDVLAALQYTLNKIDIIGQNFNYDADYFLDNFGMRLHVAHDTRVAQNVLFPGLPASLAFLSSMNCAHHRYWKDDARDWNNLRDFEGLFRYNCLDVCATFEVAQRQREALTRAKLERQFQERMRYSHYVFDMQQRGVIRDGNKTHELETEIEETCHTHAMAVAAVAGRAINIGSPTQVATLLYKELGLRRPVKKSEIKSGLQATNGPTGEEELKQVIKWHPERRDLLEAIMQYRSLMSAKNNFLGAALDPDGKLRTAFSPTGTETFRLTSGKNNFHRGANLLNISAKKPNLRKAIVPPSGYTIFDCDLARADLQIVVWEANDADLKQKLREGVDIHIENAKDIFGVSCPSDQQRAFGKVFVHLTDYGGMARTCAIQCGTTVHEADTAQRRWFAAHPGILEWHKRTRAELNATRTVTNVFGYRRIFFDRVDEAMFRAGLAWKPQSTIALLASLIHMRMEDEAKVEVFLQMYDSVAGLYPTVEEATTLPLLYQASRVLVPYEDPLYIDMGIKTSTVSWGDCEEREWPVLLKEVA